MKNEENKMRKGNASDLLTLIEILNSFERFNDSFFKTFKNKNVTVEDYTNIIDIRNRLDGFNYTNKTFDSFYFQNENTLKTINKNTDFAGFFKRNYEVNNERKLNDDFNFFYKYFKENKDNLDSIKFVLKKLHKLGLSTFCFDESADFTEKIYYHNFNFLNNAQILDNMYAIPSADGLKYKTNKSSYLIKIHYYDSQARPLRPLSAEITLNSLIFNSDRLPDNLGEKYITSILKELEYSKKDASELVRSSVFINSSIEELICKFNSTSRTIAVLDNVSNKKELITTLENIKGELEQLKKLGVQFNQDVINNNSDITDEMLDYEKKLYLDYIVF